MSEETILQTIQLLPLSEWTVSGLGFMRAKLDETRRLHIWDSMLKLPGVTPVHTHPWDFVSTVHSGLLINQMYLECPEPTECAFGVPWRSVTIRCGADGMMKDAPIPTKLHAIAPIVRVAGEKYRQEKAQIHSTYADDGTVTVIDRTFYEDRETARVFMRGETEWVDARVRPATFTEHAIVTQRALALWA